VTNLPAHILQLGNDRSLRIHPPLNTVLSTSLLAPIQSAGGNRAAGNALLKADVAELVDG
jgi:hypothetical protein